MPTISRWTDTAKTPKFPALQKNLRVDAAVIGGGNTGVTAAYLLKKAGQRVAIFERDRCASVDTGHTSAHLTHVTDLRLRELLARFGRDQASAVWHAGTAAIDQIEQTVVAEGIDCDFARVPGYLHASLKRKRDERDPLREEARLANDLGFSASYVDAVPLCGRPGICFPNQARFHPIKYLAGLLSQLPGGGCQVYEHTEVEEFDGDSLKFKANGHTVTCKFIFIATDVPLMGGSSLLSATLLQTKIAPYTSYCIGGKLPKQIVPDALFWDTSDPYFYLRFEQRRTHDYAIFGGADHKTGQVANPEQRFQELEGTLLSLLPQAEVDHRWSGQVIESVDGLPFIGATAERQFVATGFSGNGLTFGTLAAMMACDAALGRENPWHDLFDVRRKTVSTLPNFVRENADYPYYMIKDRLAASDGKLLRSVKAGEGKILKINGKRVAAYRDIEGKVTKLSPVCTHMGCIVHWNAAERTWDCPCHGSRFQPTGEVLAGPAETPLENATE